MTVVNEARTSRRSKGRHKPEGGAHPVVALLIVLAGLGIMLYPVVATVNNNRAQTFEAHRYDQRIDDLTPEQKAAEVKDAHRYNETVGEGPVLDPWLARVDESNTDYQGYLQQLDLTDAMGRIAIPAIGSDLPIYHGTTEDSLGRGIGHLYGSSLPVGGPHTHSVLTGHTGLPQATLWDNLIDVKEGDAVYLSVSGEKLKYEVHDIEVVLPNETGSLKTKMGEDIITLITCTPYGVNSHRILVHAHRVPMDDPREVESVFNMQKMQWQWWMTLAVVAAGLVLSIVVALIVRSRYVNKRKEMRP